MSDSEEDIIDAFFNFSIPLKRYPLPKTITIVPKKIPPKVTQNAERLPEGTDYASSHIENMSNNLSRVSKNFMQSNSNI